MMYLMVSDPADHQVDLMIGIKMKYQNKHRKKIRKQFQSLGRLPSPNQESGLKVRCRRQTPPLQVSYLYIRSCFHQLCAH